MDMKKNKKSMYLLGLITGFANGLLGSGGGIIAVPMLKKCGYDAKKAHACSLGITLPLSAVSAVFYLSGHSFDIKEALDLIPFGLAGALIGTAFMKKISPKWLTRLFGVLLIIAGWRMMFS